MGKNLKVETLDTERFVKVNNLQPISNPVFFVRNGVPTSDGLLSNEIFGISKDERANIYAYIDLQGWFIDPLSYKFWARMDRNIEKCVCGTATYIIDDSGQLVESPSGDNGIDFLRNNIDKIKIKKSSSRKRDTNIEFIEKNIRENKLFIRKYPVIPAYYRDVFSGNTSMGVGDINKLYNSLIISSRGLKETEEFGFSVTNAIKGRMQNVLVEIYNWFTKEPNIGKKMGIIRRSVLSKTTDYASRLVMSAPELKVESKEDMMVDVNHCALPLASALANLFPYVMYWCRRFFDNEFGGLNEKVLYNSKGEAEVVHVKDPAIQFSDEIIKKNIKRFIHGYSNRLIPIRVELDDGTFKYLNFKGRTAHTKEKKEDIEGASEIFNRRLTWCDIFYMACVEMSKDKHVLITRFPLDTYFGQFPNKIRISSTVETEPVYINGVLYKYYPKITDEMIGSNTASMFKDTLNISNVHLGSIGGDYEPPHCSLLGEVTETKTTLTAGTSR